MQPKTAVLRPHQCRVDQRFDKAVEQVPQPDIRPAHRIRDHTRIDVARDRA